MNKEYTQMGDMVVISTDEGLKKKEILSNMTEILETENNIEEMRLIQDKIENRELFNYKNILERLIIKIGNKACAIGYPVALIFNIIAAMTGNWYLVAILLPTMLIGPSIVTPIIASIKASKTYNLIHVKANEIVEKVLKDEKKKLEQLNKEAVIIQKNDLGMLNETIKITKTKSIKNLKFRLNLIGDYELNKKKFTNYYENNKLCSKLYSKGYTKDSILVIEEFVKNDTEQKCKVKTLKK